MEFIKEHAEIIAVLISILAGGWVFLGTALVKLRDNQIVAEQNDQDRRLGDLEKSMGKLTGDSRDNSADLRNVIRRLDEAAEEMKEHRQENREDFADLKSLIRQKHVSVET